ncbi:MAG: hypothetical protein ABIO72_03825 [Patescibacteria group bacterium]
MKDLTPLSLLVEMRGSIIYIDVIPYLVTLLLSKVGSRPFKPVYETTLLAWISFRFGSPPERSRTCGQSNGFPEGCQELKQRPKISVKIEEKLRKIDNKKAPPDVESDGAI